MMYISRMLLTEKGVRELVESGDQDAYGMHQFLWDSFPDTPKGSRPFIYSVSADRRTVLCVSSAIPSGVDGRWAIESKEYEPQLGTGAVLSFHLHANPTVANSRTGKHQRHSVVMNARKIGTEVPGTPLMDTVSSAVTEWMVRKGSLNGFTVKPESLMVSAYHSEECCKKDSRPLVITTVDIDGILTVEDPDLFRQALFRGIGTSKGMGCGLLLVKRI